MDLSNFVIATSSVALIIGLFTLFGEAGYSFDLRRKNRRGRNAGRRMGDKFGTSAG